jgi:Leucine-rich repeat (LRR) protein
MLTELWLSHNYIASIPAEIKKLAGLKQLWLSNNKLTYIHRDLRVLSLDILSLYGNVELEVPDFIRHMSIEFFYDVDNDSELAENAETSLTLLKPSM